MSNIIGSAVIEVGVDSSGVDAGFARIDGAVARTGRTLESLGGSANNGFNQIGAGGVAAAGKVDNSTKNMIGAIQRATAAMSSGAKGSAEYYASLANTRGLNAAALKPYLDQLDAMATKTKLAADAQRRLDESTKFLDGLKDKADSIGKTAAQLAQLRAEQLGVADAAAPMIAKLLESEGAMNGVEQSAAELVSALGAVIAAQKLLSGISSVALSAGKYEQMGIVMNTLGNNTGHTAAELAKVQEALQKTGISMAESRQTIGSMISANIELADATKLARLAQDAAAIAQTSSSEAMNRLISGIQTAQVEVLRTMGLNVNFEKSYSDLAATLGKNSKELSEQEKMHARVNAAMEKAPTIAGAYAASMESATKQMGSLSRYADNAAISIGQAFQPAFGVVIRGMSESLKLAGENANYVAVALAVAAGAVVTLTGAVALLTVGTRAFAVAAALVSANPWVLGLTAAVAAISGVVAAYGVWKSASADTAQAVESHADRAIAATKKTALNIGETVKDITDDIKKLNDELDKSLGNGPNKLDEIKSKYAEQVRQVNAMALGRKYVDAMNGSGDYSSLPQDKRSGVAETIKQQMIANAVAIGDAAKAIGQAQEKMVTQYVSTQSRMTDAQKKQAAFIKAEQDHASALLNAAGDMRKVAEINAAYKSEIAGINKTFSADKSSKISSINKEITAYATLSASIRTKIDESNLELSLGRDATEAQKIRIKLDQDIATGRVKMTAAHRAAIDLDIESLGVAQAAQKYEKDSTKFYEDQTKARYDAASASIKSATDEADKNELLARTFGMTKTAIEQLELARLEEQLTQAGGIAACTAETAALEALIDAKKRNIAATGSIEIQEVAKKANEDMASDWKKTVEQYDDIFRKGFADMLNNGKDGWKAWTKSLTTTFKTAVADQIYKMFAQPFVVKMVASLIGAVGGSAVSGVAQAATGGGSLLSAASSASSLYNMAGQAATWMGLGATAATAGAMGGAGAVASLGTISATGGAIGGFTGAGTIGMSALGGTTGLTAAGTTAAGTLGGTAASGGIMSGIGSAVAAIPVWGWALAAVAVVAALGGRGEKKTTSQGIEGNFGASGFSGNNFANWKQDGGWFHSDRDGKKTSALDGATTKQFSDSYAAIKTTASSMAATLGLSADSIANYSRKISVTLTSDTAKNQDIIAGAFAAMGDDIAAKIAPGIASFGKEGETASATLQRLSGSITGANAWLSILRQRLFQVSMAGGDAASKLADAFGGLENLGASSAKFYELYYTEGERTARIQQDMADALAKVNLAMPATKDELRELAGSLDLNTAAGRAAYATLLTIAPEFANVADITARMAQETAQKLMIAFTGNGQLLPALDATSLKTLLLKDTLVSTYTAAGNISTLFLDVNSGLITFGTHTTELTGGMTGAQLAADKLQREIVDLGIGADGTVIDIAGLTSALANVNTETFVATMGLVFENLAERISGVINDIGGERIAVREAALQIINPTVMSKAAIQKGIGGINAGLPSNAILVAAGGSLQSAAAARKAADANATRATSYLAATNAGMSAATAAAATAAVARVALDRAIAYNAKSVNLSVHGGNDRDWWYRQIPGAQQAVKSATANLAAANTAAASATAAAAGFNLVTALEASATAASVLALANNNYAAAASNAKLQQLAYAKALQNFAIDANKSVSKLSKLREETVKYYEAQKQLADLMGNSAAGLRGTVADYRYSQLSDAQQFDKLQSDYAKAYAMALSTDGETLAGYGNTLNSALNPLLEKARSVLSDTAYNSFSATALARAETIAGRLEVLTPTDYAADSLAMLGTIDATLAMLDASSRSAEKIISDAVNAGSDKTAAGLHAVIAALTGQAIPGFASGGDFGGGLRIVGENGPELEATGASRIFNAAQTRSMLSGSSNTARLEALVERQTQELSDMRAELRAIASSNAKMARLADRNDSEGMLVRTDADTPLNTVAA